MPDRKMLTHPKAAQPSTSPGAALYVDAENLRDAENARQVVASVVADWPGNRPPLGSLSLYVRADKAELWRLWAEDAFPSLRLRVRGVQHFSANNSKNSADMAIAADAVSDLVTGRANDVAVVSNDSDFAALFVKVRELAHEAGAESAPFLWITAPDGGALSPEIAEFIPAAFRWDLSVPPVASAPSLAQPTPKSLPAAARPALAAAPAAAAISDEVVAAELLRQLPEGRFRAADAQEVVRRRWPDHPMSSAGSPQFGQYLSKEIWPHLQKLGVILVSPRSPRTYEITDVSKQGTLTPRRDSGNDLVVLGASPELNESVSNPDLKYEQLAAVIAAGINEEVFAAAAAQAVIKQHWPDHPAATQIQQTFGVWFKDHIWPILERNGVILASEKPRRYEMTPDARHNLIALA